MTDNQSRFDQQDQNVEGYQYNAGGDINVNTTSDKNEQNRILQNFRKEMNDLLTSRNLFSFRNNELHRAVVKDLILSTLYQLNSKGNERVLDFLKEAELIKRGLFTFRLTKLKNVDFGNLSLYGLDFSYANLTGANLSNAKLDDTNLRRSFLNNADLRGAYLGNADLRGAFLYETNLRRSHLDGANLRGAYLGKADLRGAYLHSANLRAVNLFTAGFREKLRKYADLIDADLIKANLSEAYLQRAKYSTSTTWPEGFDPQAAEAILVK